MKEGHRTLEERTVDVVIAPVFASMAVEHLRAEILYDEPLVVVAGARSVWAKRRNMPGHFILGLIV